MRDKINIIISNKTGLVFHLDKFSIKLGIFRNTHTYWQLRLWGLMKKLTLRCHFWTKIMVLLLLLLLLIPHHLSLPLAEQVLKVLFFSIFNYYVHVTWYFSQYITRSIFFLAAIFSCLKLNFFLFSANPFISKVPLMLHFTKKFESWQ